MEQTDSNDQIISIESDVQAGRLLLHWGVEGGKDYKGGWRLPGAGARPEGTVQYKDRALQTPFRQACVSSMSTLEWTRCVPGRACVTNRCNMVYQA